MHISANAVRLNTTFSIGLRREGLTLPLTPSTTLPSARATKDLDYVSTSDTAFLHGITAFVARTKDILVPYFTELLNTDDEELTHSASPGLLAEVKLRRWDNGGVSLEALGDLLCSGTVSASEVDIVFRAEAQLLRCMISTSDSLQRLFLLVVWCWVVSVVGYESDVIDILAVGHGIGMHMVSMEDEPTPLKEHFFRAYEYSEMLNHKWAMVISRVFGLRKRLGVAFKDLALCQHHSPFRCPKYIERVDRGAEEEHWLHLNPHATREEFAKHFGLSDRCEVAGGAFDG